MKIYLSLNSTLWQYLSLACTSLTYTSNHHHIKMFTELHMVLGHCYVKGRILITQQIKTTKCYPIFRSPFSQIRKEMLVLKKENKQKTETHEGSYISNSSANSYHSWWYSVICSSILHFPSILEMKTQES